MQKLRPQAVLRRSYPEITTMDDLSHKLTKSFLESFKDPIEAFESIAQELLTSYVIQKGEVKYRLTDIEFYLYHDGHKDIITYPRISPTGSWFFHSSGVDITFESDVFFPKHSKKPRLTTNAFFGGILIRGIEKIEPSGKNEPFKGPMLSCDELFDQFDAFGNVQNFPKLVPCKPMDGKVVQLKSRFGLNPDADKKVDSILKYNYVGSDIDREVLVQAYKNFLNAPYHYILQR